MPQVLLFFCFLTAFSASAQNLGPATDSASSPGHTWNGNTNTGIFRPAASTVGISTGGVERVRVTSGGNVGIGTTNPQSPLQVAGYLHMDTVAGSPPAG